MWELNSLVLNIKTLVKTRNIFESTPLNTVLGAVIFFLRQEVLKYTL